MKILTFLGALVSHIILLVLPLFLFGCIHPQPSSIEHILPTFNGTETLKIDSMPRGANVSANGVHVGKTPCVITMKKGARHSPRIVLSHKNHAKTCIDIFQLNKDDIFPPPPGKSLQLKFDEIVVPLLEKNEVNLFIYGGELVLTNDTPRVKFPLLALHMDLFQHLYPEGRSTIITPETEHLYHLLDIEFRSDGTVKDVSVVWTKKFGSFPVKIPSAPLPKELHEKIKSFVASEESRQILPGHILFHIF